MHFTCSKVLNFKGSIVNNNAVLRWNSKNEGSVKEYIVEKSLEGINFTQADAVNGVKEMNGANYVFTDPEIISSMAYYRLRLINKINLDKYSNIVVLYNKNESFKVSAVNPFKVNFKNGHLHSGRRRN